MSFDLDDLALAVARHGVVVRVVVAAVAGSAPREVGAAMIVWAGGQSGTIGGGALEFGAGRAAREILAAGGGDRLERVPLGPAVQQCCGGAVTLLSEMWDAPRLARLAGAELVVRPLPGRDPAMPLSVRRLAARARGQGVLPVPGIRDGWMIEPVAAPVRSLWIWGAGHVGRALVGVLAPLPGLRLTWVDTDESRFPEIPQGVTRLTSPEPGSLVATAPTDAEHLVLTFSHALDLDLCHRLLLHGFGGLGLIGSATKWARFRSRLAALGHADAQISRIRCPIGDPALGKHPQAIAVGVVAALLRNEMAAAGGKERAG